MMSTAVAQNGRIVAKAFYSGVLRPAEPTAGKDLPAETCNAVFCKNSDHTLRL